MVDSVIMSMSVCLTRIHMFLRTTFRNANNVLSRSWTSTNFKNRSTLNVAEKLFLLTKTWESANQFSFPSRLVLTRRLLDIHDLDLLSRPYKHVPSA